MWIPKNFKYLVFYKFFYNSIWTQLVSHSEFEGTMSFGVNLAQPIIVILQLFFLEGHFWLFSKCCLAYVLMICWQKILKYPIFRKCVIRRGYNIFCHSLHVFHFLWHDYKNTWYQKHVVSHPKTKKERHLFIIPKYRSTTGFEKCSTTVFCLMFPQNLK